MRRFPVLATSAVASLVLLSLAAGCSDSGGDPAGPLKAKPDGDAGAQAPEPEKCEPAPLTCSEDRRRAVGCDESGQKLEVECQEGETCRGGACLGPLEIERVTSATPKQLTEGNYAVAVVDTRLERTSIMFPAQITGQVGAVPKNMSLQVQAEPEAHHVACATPEILGLRPVVANVAAKPPMLGARAYKVGDTRGFHYPSSSGTLSRTGRLRAIGQYANFWEDQTDGGSGSVVPESVMEEVVRRYDGSVYPRLRQLFGDATDVDGNGKIDVFFTNLLPSQSAEAFVMPQATLRPPGYYAADYDFGEVVYTKGLRSGANAAAELMATVAHETQHLIYFGRRMAPYLASGQPEPMTVHADMYTFEGFAEFATLMAGQAPSGLVENALTRALDHVSIANLFLQDRLADPYDQVAGYGGGATLIQYMFDRAGGANVVATDRLEDRGGKSIVEQITTGSSGPGRMTITGKAIDRWYVDFAGALLASTIPGRLPKDPVYTFNPTQKDPTYGGPVGALLDQKWMSSAMPSGPLVRRKGWAAKPSQMLGGGLGFYEFSVGATPVTLKVTSPTASVLIAKL
jgi:hypothetical protein